MIPAAGVARYDAGVAARDETPSDEMTTLHVRRAHDGDRGSVEWLVARFTPLLLAQARYRLGDRMAKVVDPEDVVSEIWMAALPKLSHLEPRAGRLTPVLLKFLSTTLLYRVNNLTHRAARHGGRTRPMDGDSHDPGPAADLAADVTNCVSRTIRGEDHDAVTAVLAELDPDDRHLIIMRGVEQVSNRIAAMLLGLEPNTAAVRYRRALEKVRRRLPTSILAELPED